MLAGPAISRSATIEPSTGLTVRCSRDALIYFGVT
jgi:hypothetical protein